jgi:pimeloyl-ACP methyl ester carboxylesterase
MSLGAEDSRVAAIVAQVPYCDPRAAGGDTFQMLRLLAAGLRDAWRGLRGRPPYEIAVVGPPGSLAVLTSPDAMPGYLALSPPGGLWRNAVAARIVLQVQRYRPLSAAARIQSPLLVCVAEQDVVTPPGPALEAASRAPHGSAKRYPCQHFEIYLGALFEQAVADQIAFLREHLAPKAAAGVAGPAAG